MPELDYASIMKAGQGLVPDMQEQMMQRQQMTMQQQQIDARTQQIKLQAQQQQDQQARMAAFRPRLAQAVQSGHTRDIANVMVEFPEFADQIKPGWEALSADAKTMNLTQTGTVYMRAKNGDPKGAAALLQQRYDADVKAGQGDETTKELIDALNSGDPEKIKQATGTVGLMLAAVDPSKFADTYGKLFPNEGASSFAKEYDDRVARFGKTAADRWVATQDTKLVPVQAGGKVFAYGEGTTGPAPSTMPTMPGGIVGYGSGTFDGDGRVVTRSVGYTEGGDPSTGGQGYAMPVANGTFTSGIGDARDGGTRSHNGQDIAAPIGSPVSPIAPGKVISVSSDPKSGMFVKVRHADGTTSSYSHLGRQDVRVGDDVAAGQSLGTVGKSGNATGSVLHLVIRDAQGRIVDPKAALGGGPVRVRSIQEANKLTPGTRYIRPDGKEMIR